MLGQGDAVWFASLREVRRQAKYIADATGVGSQVEGKTRLYKDLEQDWEVCNDHWTYFGVFRLNNLIRSFTKM